ncbi:MAG: hypothetical protein WAN65_09310, partial [Candidatus Sulfotelmatobacter sp.]
MTFRWRQKVGHLPPPPLPYQKRPQKSPPASARNQQLSEVDFVGTKTTVLLPNLSNRSNWFVYCSHEDRYLQPGQHQHAGH